MEPVTLTTARLLLRRVGPQDTDAVFAAVQDDEIQRWTMVPSPYLLEHARTFTEEIAPKGWESGSLLTFGLFLPEGEELVGMLDLAMRSLSTAEIGFWGTREHRGNGYVTEAAVEVCRWAFTQLSVDRVEWRAEVGNHASRAVAERAGFVMEGVLRAAIIHRGVRRDAWVGGLLPSDLGLPSTAPYLPAQVSSTQPSA